jgi:hypothetical protein
MVKKWIYTPEKSIVEHLEEGYLLVCFTDDIDADAIEEVVKLHNRGVDIVGIDNYLKDDSYCTQEQREFLIESITVYLNSKEMETPLDALPGFLGTEQGTPVVLGNKTSIVASQILQQIILKAEPIKTKAAKVVKPVGKVDTQSVKDKLQAMADKASILLELVIWVDESLNSQDVPANLSKEYRELLLGYIKEIEGAKSKVLDHISKL